MCEQEFAKIQFCYIPPGNFIMGSYQGEIDSSKHEFPQHEVRIRNGFWMSKYPIIQKQWNTIMDRNPSFHNGVNRPVDSVEWESLRGDDGYFERLNASYPGYNFRLPSEAEWEYAYRAGTTTRFYWGDDLELTEINRYAWYYKGYLNNLLNWSTRGTKEVGLKLPNAWGLYDMAGNVWERCEDYWHKNYIGAPKDESPWLEKPWGLCLKFHVIRGGSWCYSPKNCRAAARNIIDLNIPPTYIGFRVVFNVCS